MFLFLYFCDRVSLSVFETLESSAKQVYVGLLLSIKDWLVFRLFQAIFQRDLDEFNCTNLSSDCTYRILSILFY